MSSSPSERPTNRSAKRPYVTPRVLQVQRRADGDNLSVGCKTSTGSGPASEPCSISSCSVGIGS